MSTDVVDLRRIEPIQQHDADDGHGPLFGDFPRLVETDLARRHPAQLDPLGKSKRRRFSRKTRKPVNPLVVEAAVAIARRMVKHEKVVGECLVETDKGKNKGVLHGPG